MAIIQDKEWIQNTVNDIEKNQAMCEQDITCILGIEYIMKENSRRFATIDEIVSAQGIIALDMGSL